MKLCWALIALLSALIVPAVVGQDISAGELIEKAIQSADNLTTYTYSRSAESKIFYSNESQNDKFDAIKVTEGRVNLTAESGMWRQTLADKVNGDTLTWDGYFINGSEYWREDSNWTRFNTTDPQAILEDYNELPSQVELLNYSDLSLAGSERIDGEDCYKLVGTPITAIAKTILGVQLYASYLGSPFPLPDDFSNKSFDFDNTKLLLNSNVTVSAWISKDTYLPRRTEVDSSITFNPAILNIDEPQFEIESTLHEVTDWANFGKPVQIELPKEAQNSSFRMKGADWRWAVFGLVEP